MVEAGQDDDFVRDVEVRVAGGEALAVLFDITGRGQIDDAPRFSLRIAQGGEASTVLAQEGVVFVGGVFLDNGDHRVRVDETGQVVDVAVGVVADNAFAEPEDLFHTKVIAQVVFDFLLGEVRVAILIEQARLGGEQRAFAVYFDGAALEDHGRGEKAHSEKLGDMLGYIVVEIARWIFAAPRVVAPIDDRHFLVVADEDRSVIAAPRLVGGEGVEMDARVDRGFGFFERGADVFFVVGGEDVDVDLFAFGEEFGEMGPKRGDGLERVGKADALGARPGEPGGVVARPFGGHAEAEFARDQHVFLEGGKHDQITKL